MFHTQEIHFQENQQTVVSCADAFEGFTFDPDKGRGGGQVVLGQELYSPTFTYDQEKYVLQVIGLLNKSFFDDGGDAFVNSFTHRVANRIIHTPVFSYSISHRKYVHEKKSLEDCFIETVAEFVEIAYRMDESLKPAFNGMFAVAGYMGYMELWQNIRYYFSIVGSTEKFKALTIEQQNAINFNRKALDKPTKTDLDNFKRFHSDGGDNGYMVVCTGRVFAQRFHKQISLRILGASMHI